MPITGITQYDDNRVAILYFISKYTAYITLFIKNRFIELIAVMGRVCVSLKASCTLF